MENGITVSPGEGNRIGTALIAEGFGRRHEQVIRLVKKYRVEFEELATLSTSRKRGKTKRFDELLLTFNQVLFLVSIMQNNENAVAFKVACVKGSSLVTLLDLIADFQVTGAPKRFIYGAADEHGRVKIGISNNPERRLKELNIGNADDLTLVFTRESKGEGYSDEVKLHDQCERFCVRGEWFAEKSLEVIDV